MRFDRWEIGAGRPAAIERRMSGRRGFPSPEIVPGDREIAPLLELIPSQTRPVDDVGAKAQAFFQLAQPMRLDDEVLAVGINFDEPVQPDCVAEIEFHGVAITCKGAASPLKLRPPSRRWCRP